MELKRFAFSTNAYIRHPLSYALNHIAAAGFKGVEILADKPHAWLDTFTPADLSRLQKQLKKNDLYVSNLNANATAGFWSDAPQEPIFEPSIIVRGRELREWRLAYTKKALRIGKEIGAHSVSITSGKTLNGVPPEKAQKLLVEGLKRLLDYADKIGQRLSLHCEPGLFIEKTGELAALIKMLRSKNFGASLDLSHCAAAGEDPRESVRKLSGSIFDLHLADIRAQKYYPRIPGDGDMNFKALFKTLDAIKYAGPITWALPTCDEKPNEACRKTFEYVKSIATSHAKA